MIKNFKASVLALILIFCFYSADALSNDFRARLSVSAETEIINDLSASVDVETRFDKYLTTYDRSFVEATLSYDIIKPLRFGVSGRFMHDMNDVRKFSTAYRASAYLRYKTSIDDFDLKIKTAVQYGFDELSSSFASGMNKLISRNSIGIDYNWFGTRFTPFAEYEFFYHINNTNGGIINQSRIKGGISYKINKPSEISLFYMFENEFNVARPVDSHIIGFNYNFKF
ncbi:MAG: DUF2490 domain-containing protein [Prolixibacteraceae bacterium]|nr:DUF2490 domain-containing protein [Prolixibacteraceae bacterium]